MTTVTKTVVVASAGSLALLAGAFLFQALGYAPCKLCLWQRWPHAIAVAAGLLIWMLGIRKLAWVGALAALTTACLGIYHSGVEQGYWTGPTTCTSSALTNISTEELLDQILAAPLIRCDEIAWSLLGLSMASWNAIISLLLAALWVVAARRA